MKNYLVLNGQKIELTPEQYQEVCNAVLLETKSPFDRREKGEAYWFNRAPLRWLRNGLAPKDVFF